MKTISIILCIILISILAAGSMIREDTAVTVMVGPMVDFADGKTVLANNGDFDPNDIVCRLIKGSTESTLSLTKTGGSHNFNLTGYGMATLTLTAADTNTAGRLALSFCDAEVGGYATETILPLSRTWIVLPGNIYDSVFADDTALSKFNAGSDTVTTDTASRTASKADVSGLATAAALADANDLTIERLDTIEGKIDQIPTKPSAPRIQ